MARTTILLLILALLLCSTSSTATRRLHPTFHKAAATTTTTMKQQDKGDVKTGEIEEGCEGIGEQECLMRRTLVAHLDYIYTQKETP